MKRKARTAIPGERSSPRLKAKKNPTTIDLTDDTEEQEVEPQIPNNTEKEAIPEPIPLQEERTVNNKNGQPTLAEIRKIFTSSPIKGQDVTLNRLANILFDFNARCQENATEEKRKLMILPIFLSGGSGMGKSKTVEILCQLYGMTNNQNESETFIYQDMSEIRGEEGVTKILGSPPSFAGFGEKNFIDQLFFAIGEKGITTTKTTTTTTAARGRPPTKKSTFKITPNKTPPPEVIIIHFEEVDKAHHSALTILINFLETGQLTSGNRKQFVLPAQTRMIVVFTSNFGQDEIEEMNHLTDFQKAVDAIKNDMLCDGIQKPMIGRFPHILPYFYFPEEVAQEIASKSITELFERVEFEYRDYFTKFTYKKESEDLLKTTLSEYAKRAEKSLGNRSIEAVCKELKRELCCETMLSISEYLPLENLPLSQSPVLDVLEFFPMEMEEDDFLRLSARCQLNTLTYHLLGKAWEDKTNLLLILVLWSDKIMTSILVKSQPAVSSNTLALVIPQEKKYCDYCHCLCKNPQRVTSREMVGSKIRIIFKNFCNLCVYNNSLTQGPKLLTSLAH